MIKDDIQKALAAHRAGDLGTAEAGYRAVLEKMPEQADTLALLAVLLDSKGQQGEALTLIQKAIEIDPKAALFKIHLGNILANKKDWHGAIKAFEDAIKAEPRFPDLYYNLGNAQRQIDAWEEAENSYKNVLVLEPKHFMARNNLALIYGHQKAYDKALPLMEEVVAQAPDYVEGWLNLSSVAEKAHAYERALEAAQEAARRAPENAKAWFGAGVALNRLGRDEEALGLYKKAASLREDWGELWDNIGQTCQGLCRLEEAEDAFRKSILYSGQAIDEEDRVPKEEEYGHRHWHLALLELLKGDYVAGFRRYRARFKGVDKFRREKWPRPIWTGEDLTGKALVINEEQGFGDCIMMARFLPLLKEKAARVFFVVRRELYPLFENWEAVDLVVPRGGKLPDFDYHASIFDIPMCLGTTVETLPQGVPYIPVPVADEKTKIEGDGRLKVGVVWAGTPQHNHDARRSLSLEIFKELFEEKQVQFFSFNRDKREGDDALLTPYDIIDLAPRLNSFMDSARLMMQMDLIISCDTATAHLAGALGKPVWTLLPFSPDWRWLLGREDTPWYPTMRLFRQKEAGDWEGVMAALRLALQEMLQARL